MRLRTRDIVLGAVAIHPGVSGYQLRRISEQSTNFFVSMSLSSIYPILGSLVAEGLATFEVEELLGKRDRKAYTITPAGQDHLAHTLREPPTPDFSLAAFQETLMRLIMMADLTNDDIRVFLERSVVNLHADRRRVHQEAMGIAEEYLTLEGRARTRYLRLWTRTNHYLAGDLDLKIGWIQGLIDSLDAELGS